jgi:hypothetical protein
MAASRRSLHVFGPSESFRRRRLKDITFSATAFSIDNEQWVVWVTP